ncbi:uncharacterized [Tachysurus ichikawai]
MWVYLQLASVRATSLLEQQCNGCTIEMVCIPRRVAFDRICEMQVAHFFISKQRGSFDKGCNSQIPFEEWVMARVKSPCFHPQLLPEPLCTPDSIPQPALKQQGSKLLGLEADLSQ